MANVDLCLLHKNYQTRMDIRALVFITPKLQHWNELTRTCVYYTKVTALKWTNVDLCVLHQSYQAKMD